MHSDGHVLAPALCIGHSNRIAEVNETGEETQDYSKQTIALF
jgi:hypothetical protein